MCAVCLCIQRVVWLYPFLPMCAVCLCIQRVVWLYQCVQYVCVFKGWYGCQLPIPTNVCSMSVYSKGGMAASYPFLPMCAVCLCIQRVVWLFFSYLPWYIISCICIFNIFFFSTFLSTLLFLGRNLGHLTKGGSSYPFLPMCAVCLCIQRVVWLPATHSYQCVQYVCVFKGWYVCQCLGF